MPARYITTLDRIPGLSEAERQALAPVAARYAFRVNDYYLGLIDWADPADPIRRLIIPHPDEMKEWGRLDASNEAANTKVKGLQHKYPHTALLLVNEVCGAYCRYCFRKRLFMNDNDEAVNDLSEGMGYIRSHPAITNVLLTGGDPLVMATARLERILAALRTIPHVGIIRIGSKMPAFNPERVLGDAHLLEVLAAHSSADKRIYLMAHFDHPRELTPLAIRGLDALHRAGVIAVNQCPLIRGVNDDAQVLAELFRRLSFIGVPPYYLFQGRPTAGNQPFELPIVRGYALFEQAKTMVSGLAKRARFVMSHERGKIEIVGIDAERMYLRFHRARDPADEGRFMVFRRDDQAYWLDQLEPVEGLGGFRFPPEQADERLHGPE
ncbi:MAG: KamA family radical SAM protein [Planctomycetes bacterium]|nr:KamA family radical SAM protein [Planctomycetota bacterium]